MYKCEIKNGRYHDEIPLVFAEEKELAKLIGMMFNHYVKEDPARELEIVITIYNAEMNEEEFQALEEFVDELPAEEVE